MKLRARPLGVTYKTCRYWNKTSCRENVECDPFLKILVLKYPAGQALGAPKG